MNIDLEDQVGQTVYAIGYPDVAGGNVNITKGDITSKTVIKDFDFIISDVGVSYGNSGGAVVNEGGELLGLATQVSSSDLLSLTYILDLNSLKEELRVAKLVLKANPDTHLPNFDKVTTFIENIFSVNNVVTTF